MNEKITRRSLDLKETAATRRRYQRIAPVYDAIQRSMERRYLPWRQRQWSLVKGPKVLEVGVGTGQNMLFYRPDLEITAIDLTPGMLDRAQRRAAALSARAQLCLGDVQALDFPDDAFDSVVATFVFCSVPNPVLGLTELGRVVRPGGQIVLLEHVRSAKRLIGAIMDVLNPLVVRVVGANINRRTVENIQKALLRVDSIEDAGIGSIVKLITVQPAE